MLSILSKFSKESTHCIATLVAALSIAAPASAEVPLGDFGALALQLESDVRVTDNILRNNNSGGDTVYRLLPALLYRSDAGAASINARVQLERQRFEENRINDSDDFSAWFGLRYPDQPRGELYQAALTASYEEDTSANTALLTLNRTINQNTKLDARYHFSDILSLRSGGGYESIESETEFASDLQELEVPISLYYKVDSMISLGAGYRWRETISENQFFQSTSQDQAVFFGLENLLSELLSYRVLVGYQMREFIDFTSVSNSTDTFADESGVFLEAEVLWTPSERQEVALLAGNEFGSTVANQSTETTYAEIEYRHRLNDKIRASLILAYEEIFFIGLDRESITSGRQRAELFTVPEREDTQLRAGLRIDYNLIPDRLDLKLKTAFIDNQSTLEQATYQAVDCTFSVTAIF